MFPSNQAAGSSISIDNFTSVFNAASIEFQRVAGKRLDTHPFAAQLDICDGPRAVSDLLRTQIQAFSKFYEGNRKLNALLDPTVQVLFTFLGTLGEASGLVSHRDSSL